MATAIARSLLLTAFLILAAVWQRTDGLRILALFPTPTQSHQVMYERLARGLAKAGHRVDVYSHFPLKKSIKNYTDYSLAGTTVTWTNNVTYDLINEFKGADIVDMELFMKNSGEDACELMDTPTFRELFERVRKNQPYDLVIVEVFAANCYLAWGPYLNVPMVGVQSSAPLDWLNSYLGNPFNTAVDPSTWSTHKSPMSFWERLTNTRQVSELSLLYRYYVRNQDAYVERHFGPGYPTASELPRELDLLLVNSHPILDGVRAYAPVVVPVAGLHLQKEEVEEENAKLPENVQKWLDDGKDGCIYVSFGSMVRLETFPEKILQSFYESFRRISPVRVLMKIAKPEELPKGLPPNVMTQSWFAQYQVLKHENLKAFVTHGGLMSIQETLSVGVPIIGIPLFADQYTNVKSRVNKGVAIHVDLKNLDADTLTEAIEKILSDPSFEKNAKQYARLFFDRPMKPLDTAIFWIEYLARHGKQALKSPIVDMYWWQTNLIDVYGSFIIFLCIIIYIFKLLVKMQHCCFIVNRKKIKKSKKN